MKKKVCELQYEYASKVVLLIASEYITLSFHIHEHCQIQVVVLAIAVNTRYHNMNGLNNYSCCLNTSFELVNT